MRRRACFTAVSSVAPEGAAESLAAAATADAAINPAEVGEELVAAPGFRSSDKSLDPGRYMLYRANTLPAL